MRCLFRESDSIEADLSNTQYNDQIIIKYLADIWKQAASTCIMILRFGAEPPLLLHQSTPLSQNLEEPFD
jgi:hypothetical protein